MTDTQFPVVKDYTIKPGANLRGANLRYANLYGASLYGANLRDANLRDANLRGANLYGANLYGADLRGANLRGANLYGADLRGANLYGANLYGANLRDANLYGANLRDANLRDANLRGAKITKLPAFNIPQEGSLIVYKKLKGGVIATLRVPESAKRTASVVGRKCRAEYVEVIMLTPASSVGLSSHDHTTKYVVGQTVHPDKYDDNPLVECTNGIHFFLTLEEALEY